MNARALAAAVLATVLSTGAFAADADSTKVDYSGFKDPAMEFRGTRWFTINMESMGEAEMRKTIDDASKNGGAYGGWMSTPNRGGGGGGGGGGFGRGLRGRGGPATGPAAQAQVPAPAPAPRGPTTSYLDEDFFKGYRAAIDEGMKVNFPLRVLYDEQQFPSGFAGGHLRQKYPQFIGRSLEKAEQNIAGPKKVSIAIPIQNGTYIGTVRMNMDTLECVDISDTSGSSEYQIPAGNWKVMVFYLDPNANTRGLVDYLDPDAVDGLIDVMYQQYYNHMKEYFGNPIKYTFYDEPGLQHPEFRGRLWTKRFNDDFQKKYGYSPMKLYPALYYDIGPDTAAARNALYGFRADMYAENFIGRIAKWDHDHGVKMTGHLDQEEAINQVSVQGDLMKVFKHQDLPAHDDVFWSGRSTTSYKIVTSSAFNWDKPLCTAETYAAYRDPSEMVAFRTAMDQHTFGINFQVGNYPREADAPSFGVYIGRLQYLLQHGKHVADVGIVYPIASMQTAYRFANISKVTKDSGGGADANFYYALEGAVPPPEMDYMQLGEMLFRGYHLDYTWLHPEIIESKCIVQDKKLIMDNKENREEFRVIIIPGGDTINLAVAKKIQEFYHAGGSVIGTSMLPRKAAEFGKDKEVEAIIDDIFGMPAREPMTAELRSNTDQFKIWFSHPNQAGGQAIFIPRLDTTMMTDALKVCDPVRDVDFIDTTPPPAAGAGRRGGRGGFGVTPAGPPEPTKLAPTWPVKSGQAYDGAFTYIHKNKDGHDIYFFANSFEKPLDTKVMLRGDKKVTIWNPHTGEKESVESEPGKANGEPVTIVHLKLDPVKSTFFLTE